jgi:hypothetical protein
METAMGAAIDVVAIVLVGMVALEDGACVIVEWDVVREIEGGSPLDTSKSEDDGPEARMISDDKVSG